MGQIKNIKLHIVTDIKVPSGLKQKQTAKMPGGVTVKDVDPQTFVVAFAAHLKKSKLKVPEFVTIVKTSKAHELGPTDPDWYYVRAASVVRHVYLRPNVGVGAVRKIYGGTKRNGTRPNHFCLSSSNVARKVMQSLEGINLVTKDVNGGRTIAPTGRRDMDRIAGHCVSQATEE